MEPLIWESPDSVPPQTALERNALRALFRVYNDLKIFDRIKPKIFVRDDIWKRISEGGFTEASHITQTTTLEWQSDSLLNLFVRRLLNNPTVANYLNINPTFIADSFDNQREVVRRIFPDKVETGKNPATFEWIVNRIQDSTGNPAPRELIHFSECITEEQIGRLERGELPPPDEMLYDRSVFKIALKKVSETRYQQTFLAENPSLKQYTDELRGQKTEYNIESLAAIWQTNRDDAKETAERLASTGFFEKREASGTSTYWVSLIYRDALQMVRGKAFDL